jgi:alpha-tubulin suppressor-like RCC1 family protein
LSFPVQISGLTDVQAVAVGWGFFLALKNDGTVLGWGNNQLGQLGDGTTVNSETPVQVSGLTDVMGIAAGVSHAVAVKNDGTVWTWGENLSGLDMHGGALGNGVKGGKCLVPAQVIGLCDVKAVAAGHGYTIALK